MSIRSILATSFSAVLLALALMLALDCKPKDGPGPVSVGISAVVDCAKGAAHDTSLKILDDVATAIGTHDWESALGDLVSQFTGDAVACSLAKIQATAGKYFATNGDPVEGQKVERARTWLTERHVVFASYADGGAQ